MSRISIRLAETKEERERLFQFRYAIYVEEMGRVQKHADHARRRIEEPFDQTGANFIALAGDEIVGCIRWNSGVDTDFAEYVELYDMRRVGRYFPERCGTTTKLMVAPDYRHSALPLKLCLTGYAHARQRGVLCDFMDCNPHLEAQFARFGYRSYCGRIRHPEYGDVLPMLLVSVDLDHMDDCGSPLAAIERACLRDDEAVSYLRARVFAASNTPDAISAVLA